MSNNITDIFFHIPTGNIESDISQIPEIYNKEEDLSYYQARIETKLSLRKQKIEDILLSKRNNNIINTFEPFDKNCLDLINPGYKINPYPKKDFISGDIYIKIKTYFDLKDDENLKIIISNYISFFLEQKLDNNDLQKYYMASGINFKKREKFPFTNLLFNIGINTDDKILYIYSFNFIVNFSFISNEFCKELIEQKKNKINYRKANCS